MCVDYLPITIPALIHERPDLSCFPASDAERVYDVGLEDACEYSGVRPEYDDVCRVPLASDFALAAEEAGRGSDKRFAVRIDPAAVHVNHVGLRGKQLAELCRIAARKSGQKPLCLDPNRV